MVDSLLLNEAAISAAVLGNRARLEILQLLFDSRPHGLIVGDIQRAVNLPGSTLSHHLERLRAAGLVTIRRHGTFLWYLPNGDPVRRLAGFLIRMTGPIPARQPEEPAPASPPEVAIEFD